MSENFYDEIEFEDLTFENGLYTYPCPCGDKFQIDLEDMRDGWDVGVCPSCSLQIKVIFDMDDLPPPSDPTSGEPIAVAA